MYLPCAYVGILEGGVLYHTQLVNRGGISCPKKTMIFIMFPVLQKRLTCFTSHILNLSVAYHMLPPTFSQSVFLKAFFGILFCSCNKLEAFLCPIWSDSGMRGFPVISVPLIVHIYPSRGMRVGILSLYSCAKRRYLLASLSQMQFNCLCLERDVQLILLSLCPFTYAQSRFNPEYLQSLCFTLTIDFLRLEFGLFTG